jgi:isopenicillin-N epimerase
LYATTGALDRLQPLQVSWGWRPDRSRMDERDEFGSTPRLRQLEFEGTRDPCPWLAIPTAIDFQAEIGWQRIHTRIAELTSYVRRRLTGLAGLSPNTPSAPEMHGAMLAFRLPAGVEASVVRRRLWDEFRIEAPIIERPDRLLIRTSTHFYNTEAEVDRLAEALPVLLL